MAPTAATNHSSSLDTGWRAQRIKAVCRTPHRSDPCIQEHTTVPSGLLLLLLPCTLLLLYLFLGGAWSTRAT